MIKLLPTSYDGHLSDAAVLGRLTPTVTGQGTTLGVKVQPGCGLTGREAVAAGVALQLLFAVLAVKVILAGRAEVHWKTEKTRLDKTFRHQNKLVPLARVRQTYRIRWRGVERGC